MKKYVFFALIIAGCNGGTSNMKTTYSAPQTHSQASDEIDTILSNIQDTVRETNDILEGCIMPQYGLYALTQTCDNPPAVCVTKKEDSCPCAGK
jgi:hypothetical protein